MIELIGEHIKSDDFTHIREIGYLFITNCI